MRDTKYATELATVEVNECRIERILVKEFGRPEIRFSWWPEGRMANRPLDLPEEDLLILMKEAIAKGVFSDTFKFGLVKVLLDPSVQPLVPSDA